MPKVITRDAKGLSPVLESKIKARYYKNEYFEDGDHWTLKITRLRDNEVTYAKLDKEDVSTAREYSWYPHHDPNKPDNLIYLKSAGGYRFHRVITNCPDGMVVDHINHDPLDNRRCNMRICEVGDNNRNLSISKRNTSGIVGVRYRAERNVWIANRMVNRTLYSKQFNTFEEALRYKIDVLDKMVEAKSNL